ncbi:MAG: zinc-dependent peptidase [Burkholderiales bacterium]
MPDPHWLRNLFRLDKPHIPDELWQSCTARLTFIRNLAADDLKRLKGLSEELLGTKTITGAGGFEITDEIAVLIVAQAALLVLNLTLDLYGDMPGIVVYPSAFIVPQKRTDAAGVVHEWREALSGQAIDSGGGVMLSWEDVISHADSWARRNVVIHEFAHKIDMERGMANGCPPFLAHYHQGMKVSIWQQMFAAAYANFRRRVHAMDQTLPMDSYAAKSPAEFFAVASEVFFVAPGELALAYPEVYRLLARYYRQEPMSNPANRQQ